MAEAPEPRSSRLSKENLRRYFNQRNIPWARSEISGHITVELDVNTLCRNQYTLRLFISEDFPNSTPKLAVVRPPKLKQHNGTPIPPNAPEFQTLGRIQTHEHRETFQIISLPYPSTNLNPGVFVHQIFMKGIQWLNAYEEHLTTGACLAHNIREYNLVSSESRSVRIWSQALVRRLVREKALLEDHFSGTDQVKWSEDRRAVDVTIKSFIQQHTYILRVHLADDYPNSCPDLAIIYPEELFQVNGQPLPPHSQEFRTLGKSDGFLTICHFGPTEWIDNYNITSIVNMKGQVWVNAYELYLLERDTSFQDCLCRLSQCSEVPE